MDNNSGYAWLLNEQKDIMQNANEWFNSLHLNSQIKGFRDGAYGLFN